MAFCIYGLEAENPERPITFRRAFHNQSGIVQEIQCLCPWSKWAGWLAYLLQMAHNTAIMYHIQVFLPWGTEAAL